MCLGLCFGAWHSVGLNALETARFFFFFVASCFYLIILIVWTVLQDKIFRAENYLVEKHLSYLKDKIKHNDILDTLFMPVIPKNGMCALGDSVCRRHHVILSKTSGFFFCNQAELPEINFFLLLMAS